MPHLADTPVLQTERLTLRAPGPQDWPLLWPFLASERSVFVGGPYDERAAWQVLGHAIGHWVLRGFGSLVFCLKGTDAALGMAGPWYPASWPERELGWTVWQPEAEGHGYAFEAASRMRDFAFETLGWDTAVSYIDPDNLRSIALAGRLGAVRDDTAKRLDPKDVVYRHYPRGGIV